MKNSDDFPEKRKNRREKFTKDKNYKYIENDEDIANRIKKKQIKKLKENFDNEEWENWDKYYNH